MDISLTPNLVEVIKSLLKKMSPAQQQEPTEAKRVTPGMEDCDDVDDDVEVGDNVSKGAGDAAVSASTEPEPTLNVVPGSAENRAGAVCTLSAR